MAAEHGPVPRRRSRRRVVAGAAVAVVVVVAAAVGIGLATAPDPPRFEPCSPTTEAMSGFPVSLGPGQPIPPPSRSGDPAVVRATLDQCFFVSVGAPYDRTLTLKVDRLHLDRYPAALSADTRTYVDDEFRNDPRRFVEAGYPAEIVTLPESGIPALKIRPVPERAATGTELRAICETPGYRWLIDAFDVTSSIDIDTAVDTYVEALNCTGPG